ncbi:hypothetical protein [Arthrobacter sp. UYEF3]|uniref:hypothetical protein n=1 Tax=Arthrobacter sp. UYEF3 TaxID=1756365 RepID=UPI003399FBDB
MIGLFKGAKGAAAVIILAVLLGWGAAASLTNLSTPTYKGQSSLYITLQSNKSATDLNQGSTYVQSQMISFAELASTPVVLDAVISELQLNSTTAKLAGSVSATIPPNSAILQVTATNTSPQTAVDVANSVATHLGQLVTQLGPKDTDNKGIIVVKTIKTAVLPTSPSAPNADLNQSAGALLGLLLGTLAVIGWRSYQSKRRTAEKLESETGMPVIGTVVAHDGTSSTLLMVQDPGGLHAEQYRRLRENLRASLASRDSLCVELTSALTAKTVISAVNLGVAFAETGVSVLVIDADLRSRRAWGNLSSGGGLAKYLSDETETLEAAIERNSALGIDILPAGVTQEPAGKLIASSRMADLVKSVRGIYEVVIVNTPPVLSAADAVVLGELTQGAVLAVEMSKANAGRIGESVACLRISGTRIIGLAVVRRHFGLPLRRGSAAKRAGKSYARVG